MMIQRVQWSIPIDPKNLFREEYYAGTGNNNSAREDRRPKPKKTISTWERFSWAQVVCVHANGHSPNGSLQPLLYESIHSRKTTSSKPTKSAIPTEFINPEISKKHCRFSKYSILGFWPAVFPGKIIYSHACVVFFSETNSSVHVFLAEA